MHKAIEMEQRAYDQAARADDFVPTEGSVKAGRNSELSEQSRQGLADSEQLPPTCTSSPCVDDGWDDVQPAPVDPATGIS